MMRARAPYSRRSPRLARLRAAVVTRPARASDSSSILARRGLKARSRSSRVVLRELHGDLDDVLLIRVADDRNEQAAIGVDGDADVDELLEDDLIGREIDRRV